MLSFEKSLFETDSRMLRNSMIEVTHGLSYGSRTNLVYPNLIKTVTLDLLESNSNKLEADHRKGLSKNRWKVCDLRHEVRCMIFNVICVDSAVSFCTND